MDSVWPSAMMVCMQLAAWKACLLVVVVGTGCTRPDRPPEAIRSFLDPEVKPGIPADARFYERAGRGRIHYRGLDVTPTTPRVGEAVEFSHAFHVEVPFATDPQVFVHVEDLEGRRWTFDHAPVDARVAFSKMRAGETWVDRHRAVLPKDLSSDKLKVFVGLFDDKGRMTLEAKPGLNDGKDRLEVTTLRVTGTRSLSVDLPMASVTRIDSQIQADGRLNEDAWSKAEVLSLTDSMGRGGTPRYPTRLRLLYDHENLYVAFEAEDMDITERYARRDDPIYEHEAVELFLMPGVKAPATGPYVELQASPTGVIFDASFEGPRQGMQTDYDAQQSVGTSRNGTLNDDQPDRAWISEWIVPFSGLRGVEEPPKPGDEWRMNAFRIEKYREAGQTSGEYTAWSPPRVGDFHAVRRFGRMKFGGP